jgi:ribosomal protein L37E
MDNLITCERCGSDACHTQETTPEITNYFCFGCGFTTNSIMKTGEEFFEKQKNMLPELYKDLIEPDKNGLMWMPSMVNVPEKGMIFANGTDKNNWKWAAVRSVKVKEEEKEKYPIPGKKNKYYEYRMDMTTMLPFEEKNYMDALSYIDILPE